MSKVELRFEEAVRELDALVEKIESGGLPLEEMVEAYRRGAVLIGECRRKLDSARLEIKKLEDGELSAFDDDGGNG